MSSDAECISSLCPVAGARSSRCDPLPVGVGRRSAPLLRSSRSLSCTNRSWNTNNQHCSSSSSSPTPCVTQFILLLPQFPLIFLLTPLSYVGVLFFTHLSFFFSALSFPTPSSHHNSPFLFHLPDCNHCFTFQSWELDLKQCSFKICE